MTLGPVGYRHAALNVSAMAVWQAPSDDEESIQWARDTASAIVPWSMSGGDVNYMETDEPSERVRAARTH